MPIDHTRAFYARAPLDPLDGILYVEHDLWERLLALERDMLREALGDHLSNARIGMLLDRRDRVVERVEELIAERGPGAVLY